MKIQGRKEAAPMNPLMPAMDAGHSRDKVEETSSLSEQSVSVDLSASSRGVKHARELLASLADVRTDKVAELRDAVQSGSYRVDSYQIARKMVDEALRESTMTRRRR